MFVSKHGSEKMYLFFRYKNTVHLERKTRSIPIQRKSCKMETSSNPKRKQKSTEKKKDLKVYQHGTNLLQTFNLKLEQIFPVPKSRFPKLIFLEESKGGRFSIFSPSLKLWWNFRPISEIFFVLAFFWPFEENFKG